MRLMSAQLLCVAILAGFLCGWSTTTAAQVKKGKSDSTTIEVYKDKGGKYRFRMKDAESNLLCNASKGYKTKTECTKTVSAIQKEASKAKVVEEGKKGTGTHFEVYKDKGGKFRFRLKDAEGGLLASSGKGHKTMALCMDAVTAIQKTASKAKVIETK